MDETKKWYFSKGIWTGIITGILGIYGSLAANGVHIPAIPNWIFVVLGGFGIYSRATATAKIE